MSFIDHGYDRMLAAALPRLGMVDFTRIRRAEPEHRFMCCIEYESPDPDSLDLLSVRSTGATKGEALKNALALIDK